MRTTLTLEEDVAAELKAKVRKTGRPFKQVVNETLREGLSKRSTPERIPPFKVKARPMGLRPGLSLDCISELIDQVEGPFYR